MTFDVKYGMRKIYIYLLVCIIALFTDFSLKGQRQDSLQIFSNTQGIKQEAATFYESEGYTVYTKVHDIPFNEKNIERLKRKYSIGKSAAVLIDTSFQQKHVIYMFENRITEKTTQSSVHYFISEDESNIRVISLVTNIARDTTLEKFFVQAIINNSFSEDVYTPMTIDSVKFVNRYIKLGPACRWMEPHNIQCPDLGQMSWAEFRNLDRAKQMIEAMRDYSLNKQSAKILKEQSIKISFEGEETEALKVWYKINIPKFIMGGSNVLVVYYITQKVGNKNVACILSHYTDAVNADTLPPLLSEVIKLKWTVRNHLRLKKTLQNPLKTIKK